MMGQRVGAGVMTYVRTYPSFGPNRCSSFRIGWARRVRIGGGDTRGIFTKD